MYRIRTPHYSKRDPVMRWALPDRVFFACGACHILAYAFLDRYPTSGAQALWLKPDPGYRHGHIVVATDRWIFDYHGYAERRFYLDRVVARARRWWPGWNATCVVLAPDLLVCEAKSRTIEGLWLREPGQFLHDALPRACRYLDRFAPPGHGPRGGSGTPHPL